MTNAKTTGELLREARLAAGLSQQHAAYKMATHIVLISAHERGVHIPQPDTLARYAIGYNVKPESLRGCDYSV